ncbi:MAG: 4-hydroxy-tetrahydrodipicolinate synthase [Prevotellaceae bacterium]|nr:4-hydroxy-tetrahydrodipicolinate synthase [Prevotellaceae bacterium]
MKITEQLTGMGVALVTPFDKDENIDFDALAHLIEYQINSGTDYLVVCGTTSEYPTLTDEEQNKIKLFVKDCVAGRLPLVLGIGSNNTKALAEQLQVIDTEGYQAILSVTPYYNKPSQEGLYQHYAALSKVTPLPLIMYNVPGRTGVNMTAETTLRLARDFPNICAIKEASGIISQIDEIIKQKNSDFQIISGDDNITFPLIMLGATGVISVIGNAFPREFGRMVRLAIKGEYEQARQIHHRFNELNQLLFVEGNPAGVKSMLAHFGYIQNVLRLPLVPNTAKTCDRINQVLDELGL